MPERLPSRAALLELKRERGVIELGYRFLDDKRIALAQALIRGLQEHGVQLDRFRAAQWRAGQALAAAVEVHGLEGLQLYPPSTVDWALEWRAKPFLGLPLIQPAALRGQRVSAAALACLPSAAAERCAEAFAELCRVAVPLAALQANLRRLAAEFRRTQRRARALEHVILPQAHAEQRQMEALLEELEQEEVTRGRLFATAPLARNDGAV
ncbi:MAG: V-type ATP synthase subunit D [Gammaproteobacteria bacterium]|nr:V-type ATP synthase subunit D [Gammaproteobacteria bacterium]